MTEAQLKSKVLKWQKRLALLGVGHWHVDYIRMSDSPPAGVAYTSIAAVHVYSNYDCCAFWFDRESVQDSDEQTLDRTIVHEWLHVAMRNIDNAVKLDQMASLLPTHTVSMWEGHVERERENFVERLAFTLVQAFSETGTL